MWKCWLADWFEAKPWNEPCELNFKTLVKILPLTRACEFRLSINKISLDIYFFSKISLLHASDHMFSKVSILLLANPDRISLSVLNLSRPSFLFSAAILSKLPSGTVASRAASNSAWSCWNFSTKEAFVNVKQVSSQLKFVWKYVWKISNYIDDIILMLLVVGWLSVSDLQAL